MVLHNRVGGAKSKLSRGSHTEAIKFRQFFVGIFSVIHIFMRYNAIDG